MSRLDGREYPSDVTEAQWKYLEPLVPLASPEGRAPIASPTSTGQCDAVRAAEWLPPLGSYPTTFPHGKPSPGPFADGNTKAYGIASSKGCAKTCVSPVGAT